MGDYSSLAEVRRVIRDTLIREGKDPADYSVAAIVRDAFCDLGYYNGWRSLGIDEWDEAVATAKRTRYRRMPGRPPIP